MLCDICNGPAHNPMDHDGELSAEDVAQLRRLVCKVGRLLTAQSPLCLARVQAELAVDFQALPPTARPNFEV